MAAAVTHASITSVAVAADYNSVVQQVYVGYFGRPADPGGLAYFAQLFLAANAPTNIGGMAQAYDTNAAVKSLIDSFASSTESAAQYPGDNNAFVLAIYNNLFNRVADAGGLAYWADLINRGLMTRSAAALSIMAGAQGTDTTIIANKTLVASNFTKALDTPAKAAAYSGLAANIGIRAMLGTVTDKTNVATFQATVTSTVYGLAGNLMPDGVVQGLYQGVTSLTQNKTSQGLPIIGNSLGGGSAQALVLPGGTTWLLYGTSTLADGLQQYGTVAGGGAFVVSGVAVGTLAAFNQNDFSGRVTQFSAPGNVGVPTVTGGIGYGLGDGVSAELNGNIGNFPLNTIAPSGVYPTYLVYSAGQSSYNYNTPARLAAIADTWSGGLLEGGTASITIAADGALSGTTAPGCTLTGTATANASGKNFFDVAITYGGAPCVAANQTETGVGFIYGLTSGATSEAFVTTGNSTKIVLTYAPLNGMSELIIAVTNASKTHASAFFAQR
jgi:hypothetical protein